MSGQMDGQWTGSDGLMYEQIHGGIEGWTNEGSVDKQINRWMYEVAK